MKEEFIWAQKYRPAKIADCIMPEKTKLKFEAYIKKGEVPHLILESQCPGTGKTTLARAICNELGADMLFINASESRGIDTLRNNVRQFASTFSMGDGLKIVVLDEADSLTPEAQKTLRGMIEEFSVNCRFILTCNFANRIIEPIHSRCTVVNFNVSKDDKKTVCTAMMKRCIEILDTEGYEYDKKVLGKVILSNFPDNRKILNELQEYAETYGKIDVGMLGLLNKSEISGLVEAFKEKKFEVMRQWVEDNISTLDATFYSKMMKTIYPDIANESKASLIYTSNDYQIKHHLAVDESLCVMAYLVELGQDVKFA